MTEAGILDCGLTQNRKRTDVDDGDFVVALISDEGDNVKTFENAGGIVSGDLPHRCGVFTVHHGAAWFSLV